MSVTEAERQLLSRMKKHPAKWDDVHARIKESDLMRMFGTVEAYSVPEMYKDTQLPDPGTVFRRATFPEMFILQTPKGHEYVILTGGGNYARNAALLIRGK